MSALILVAAVFCLGAGIVIFGMKPHRFTNRAFLITSVLAAIWLGCVWAAIRVGQVSHDPISAALIWIRLNGIASIFWIWALWFLSYSITLDRREQSCTFRRFLIWFLVAAVLATIGFSDYYVRPNTTDQKGRGYYVLSTIAYASIVMLICHITKEIKQHRGIRRVELQFLALPLAVGSILVLSLTLGGNIAGVPSLKRLSFIPFIAGYGISVWGISFHRLYNPKEILASFGQLSGVIFIAASCTYTCSELFRGALARPFDIFVSAAFAFSFALWVGHRSRRWFRVRRDQLTIELRNAVAAITREETKPNALIRTFEEMLRQKSDAAWVTLLVERDAGFAGKGLVLNKSRKGYTDLFERTWATPEILERRRSTPQSDDLKQFLLENSIAAFVMPPCGNPAPSLLVAFGEKRNGWPFTYPEIERMQNIAELMDNVITHAQLSSEAALKQRFEYITLMSRGLAHDLKNLITPMSSLLTHIEKRISLHGAEAEVYVAARRSVRLMIEYIRETLFFGTQLVPKFELGSVSELLQSAKDITAARAERSDVTITILQHYDQSVEWDRILIQRLIVNLVNNAIDASHPGGNIVIAAMLVDQDRVGIQVSDNGSGIAVEHRASIFEPYFTTKQFGDEVRGFGLGLTICEKIAHLHGGSIFVHSEVGRGTVMTAALPISQTQVRLNDITADTGGVAHTTAASRV